jgi:hypothetical protein
MHDDEIRTALPMPIFAVGIGVGKLRDKVVEIKPKALLQAALGDHTFASGGSVIR